MSLSNSGTGGGITSITKVNSPNLLSPLYSFTNFTFTSLNGSGKNGPSTLASYGTNYPGYGTGSALTLSSNVQVFTVPFNGIYSFVVAGAKAGDITNSGFPIAGGAGNIISGSVALTKGELLYIVVGQASPGNAYQSGGAGGTFVFRNSYSNFLFAAGGGGGVGNRIGDQISGQSTPNGANGTAGGNAGPVGTGGQNGAAGIGAYSGGPGGTTTKSADGSNVTVAGGSGATSRSYGGGGGGAGIGAISSPTFLGGTGGTGGSIAGGDGGFGGGGGAGSGNGGGGGGGGGGGYSGGGGGSGGDGGGVGGGGGSNAAASVTNYNSSYGLNSSGNGYVTISVPAYSIAMSVSGTTLFTQLSSSATASAMGTFSLRAVNKPIAKAVNIRRSSDNATQDFWADRLGNLLTVPVSGQSLASWLGTATGYVVTWYDQSEKGNHASQATSANQPKIDFVNKQIDFKPSAYFNLPNGTVPYGNSNYTMVVRHNTINSNPADIVHSGTQGTTDAVNALEWNGTAYYNYWWGDDNIGGSLATGNIVTAKYDNTVGRTLYINGTSVATNASKVRNSTQLNNLIATDTRNRYLNGELYYVFLFNTALSDADRQLVEALPIS